MGLINVVSVVVVVYLAYCSAHTGPNHGKIVVCYVATWSVFRPERGLFTIEHLDPNLCTHIVYAFAGLDAATSSIKALDPYKDLRENYGKGGFQKVTGLKTKYPHLKVSLAFGGWNEGSENYSKLVMDPIRRNKFVASVVAFIKKYNFDGLDLHWKYPGERGGAPEDKSNFLLLVKELRAAFERDNFLLTAAFGPGKSTIDVAYDVRGLSVYLDFIHMMCFDYHGAWDKRTGANAPLRSSDVLNVLSVEYTINYMLKLGAPANKLVLGVPLYGRTFLMPEIYFEDSKKKPELGAVAKNVGFQGPFTKEDGFMGYNELCLELINPTATWFKFWDSESQTPFAVNADKVIVYDDVESIALKVKFAMEKQLGGITVWSIDTDDFHGDCAEVIENEHFQNFTLMRGINRSIKRSLEQIKAEKENAIIFENGEGKSAVDQLSINLIIDPRGGA